MRYLFCFHFSLALSTCRHFAHITQYGCPTARHQTMLHATRRRLWESDSTEAFCCETTFFYWFREHHPLYIIGQNSITWPLWGNACSVAQADMWKDICEWLMWPELFLRAWHKGRCKWLIVWIQDGVDGSKKGVVCRGHWLHLGQFPVSVVCESWCHPLKGHQLTGEVMIMTMICISLNLLRRVSSMIVPENCVYVKFFLFYFIL